MAIVTYPLNGIDFSAEDAETYLCTRTSGVFSSDSDFKASVTGDRQVTISPGLAWIKNSDFSGKSVYPDHPIGKSRNGHNIISRGKQRTMCQITAIPLLSGTKLIRHIINHKFICR